MTDGTPHIPLLRAVPPPPPLSSSSQVIIFISRSSVLRDRDDGRKSCDYKQNRLFINLVVAVNVAKFVRTIFWCVHDGIDTSDELPRDNLLPTTNSQKTNMMMV